MYTFRIFTNTSSKWFYITTSNKIRQSIFFNFIARYSFFHDFPVATSPWLRMKDLQTFDNSSPETILAKSEVPVISILLKQSSVKWPKK